MKKSCTIVHVIESLGIGGAEILLVNTLKELSEYQHVVVYLGGENTLQSEINSACKVYCLNFKKDHSIFSSRRKFRAIVHQHNPDIIHSHLQLATFLVRFSRLKKIPHIFTVHSLMSKDAFKNKWRRWVEQITYSKREELIAVSKTVLDDYQKTIHVKGKSHVVNNFVPNLLFSLPIKSNKHNKLRMVAIGNLKEAKNYHTLLDFVSQLSNIDFELDIYGEGALEQSIRNQLSNSGLPVFLKGYCDHPENILHNYDLFVMASSHEGFGIALAEAMACGLPVLISDISAFREVAEDAASYFSLDNATEFVNQVYNFQQLKKEGKLSALGEASRKRAGAIASKEVYLEKMRRIYHDAKIKYS